MTVLRCTDVSLFDVCECCAFLSGIGSRTPAMSASISAMLAVRTSPQLHELDAAAAVWQSNNSSTVGNNAVHDRSSATASSAIHKAIATDSLEYL
jgi:hypothetical protein